MLEQVTNVFLYSSYKSVPLLILRFDAYGTTGYCGCTVACSCWLSA